MKTLKNILVICIVLIVSNNASAQFSFGVSPGLTLNSSYFGYKINKFVPYVGFQYLNIRYKMIETGKKVNYNINQIEDYSEENLMNAGLLIPNIGVKYFFISQNNLKAYSNLMFSKPFLYGNMKENGEIVDDFDDQIKNLKIWGGELGFGAEYYFSENFSIGGEFGIRFLTAKYTETKDRTIQDPNTRENVNYTRNIESNYNINPTYSKIVVNYYFGQKKE